MKRPLAAALLVASLTAPALAADAFEPWEFGADVGAFYPISSKQLSHEVATNSLYDVVTNSGGTVAAQQAKGMVFPAITDFTTVKASYRSQAALGLHLYRNLAEWAAVGVEGGLGIAHGAYVKDPGAFGQSQFINLDYSARVSHVSFLARFGPWLGPVRPAVSIGPGLTIVSEQAFVRLVDPTVSNHPSMQILGRRRLYGELVGALGFDVRVGEHHRGTIGLEAQFHKVCAANATFDFWAPRLRAAYLFGGS